MIILVGILIRFDTNWACYNEIVFTNSKANQSECILSYQMSSIMSLNIPFIFHAKTPPKEICEKIAIVYVATFG